MTDSALKEQFRQAEAESEKIPIQELRIIFHVGISKIFDTPFVRI